MSTQVVVICIGELEFRWMLHDRHLYTVHKVPVRFQRCLACMVAKQGPCGDHKATWLCRSRLTDAAPGVDVQNGKLQQYTLGMQLGVCSVRAVDVQN